MATEKLADLADLASGTGSEVSQSQLPRWDRECWRWARDYQGFAGDYAAWCALSDAERAEYEAGASGQ